MALARLVTELTEQSRADIRRHGCLPDDLRYTFDSSSATDTTGQPTSQVYKTANRTVVSLHQGRFEAHEIVRRDPANSNTKPQRSAALAALVPSRMRYDFELIAFVGQRSFLEGRSLVEVQQELRERSPALTIPLSSLYDLRLKFLFFFGALHRQNAPKLRTALTLLGPGDWLIDGTLEPGSPVFFGIQETHWGIVLGCWKLPSENAKDLTPCLVEAADQFGSPRCIIHDLCAAMALACEQGMPGVPHRICHFHFAHDVGEDLYQQPQRDLSKRLRALGLQLRMLDQRKGQTEKLRSHVESGQAALVLAGLLGENPPEVSWDNALAREVLLAMHGWILDYPRDGERQGFPFDPYLLYLHRRLLKARDVLQRLVKVVPVAIRLAPALTNLLGQLNRYADDAAIIAAGQLYEKANRLFERLRCAMRLTALGPNPLRNGYQLSSGAETQVCEDLAVLRTEAATQSKECRDKEERKLYEIVSIHLEKYWQQLISVAKKGELPAERTTNELESTWSARKRQCRRTSGRGKLTREFFAMPAELMLVGNLTSEEYVKVVMGTRDNLGKKLAEAAAHAGIYSHWKCQQKSLYGRLPKRLLARQNFLEDLLTVCQTTWADP